MAVQTSKAIAVGEIPHCWLQRFAESTFHQVLNLKNLFFFTCQNLCNEWTSQIFTFTKQKCVISQKNMFLPSFLVPPKAKLLKDIKINPKIIQPNQRKTQMFSTQVSVWHRSRTPSHRWAWYRASCWASWKAPRSPVTM